MTFGYYFATLDKFMIKIFEGYGIPLAGKLKHFGGSPSPTLTLVLRMNSVMTIKVPYVYQNLALTTLTLLGWMLLGIISYWLTTFGR